MNQLSIFYNNKIKAKFCLYIVLFVCILGLLSACTSVTRTSCYNKDLELQKLGSLVGVANEFEAWLDATDAQLVVAARRGQNLNKHGLEFSHVAFLKKEETGWFAYHLLNVCPSDRGALYKEDAAAFLAPATQNFRIAIVIPEPHLQESLSVLLESKQELNSVFDERYNAAAYPFGTKTQNSNGWILEFFSKAVADEPIYDRNDAVAWLKQDGYEPTLLKAGWFQRAFSDYVLPHLGTAGHPEDERKAGRIWMNSAESTLNYIARYSIDLVPCNQKSALLDEKACVFSSAL